MYFRFLVINIKAKLLLFGTIFMIMLAGFVAAQSKLVITDLDVKVCDRDNNCKTDKNLEEGGEKIDEELVPGGTIEFDVEIFNNFTDEEDLEIEDVEITITIEDIDDGDELDEDDDVGDIREDDEEDVTITFDIPLEVEDGNFDVIIEVEGKDENGTKHKTVVKLTLEVEKERNEVIYSRLSLSPNSVQCSRNARVDVKVINIGRDNEDDVELSVRNAELELNKRKIFDLDDDPFDSDSKYSSSFTFSVADSVKPGIYPIEVKIVYDDGGEELIKNVDLAVSNCKVEEEVVVVKEEPEEEEEEEEVVLIQPPTITPPAPVVPTGQVITEVEERSGQFFETTEGLVVLIGIFIIVIILVIAFIVWLMRN